MVEYLDNTFGVRDAAKPFLCYLSFSPPHTIHGPVPQDGEEESYSIAGKNIVILDVMLPGVDGFAICEQVRTEVDEVCHGFPIYDWRLREMT